MHAAWITMNSRSTQNCLLLVVLVTLALVSLAYFRQQSLSECILVAHDSSEKEISPIDHWLRDQEAQMEERRRRVKDICDSQGDALKWERTIRKKFFLADEAHKLGYCRIPKVSTTTLLRYFLELSDLEDDIKNQWKDKLRSLHDKVGAMFLLDPDKMNSVEQISQHLEEKHMYPFVFVRHPFERIVSAYEDKMVVNKPGHYTKLAKKIGTSFSAFVDYIIDMFENLPNNCDIRKGGCDTDQHVTPFFSWCAFCDIDYQAIGKAETFEDDFKYILMINGLDELVTNTDVRMHAVAHDKDRAKNYFAELKPNQKESLYEIYRLDFELFDYDITGYL